MTAPVPLEERYWSEYGFRTPAEVERFREAEREQCEPCVCGHLRREHFLDARGCVHVAVSRSSGGVLRLKCTCESWRAPESPLGATVGDVGGVRAVTDTENTP